MAHDEYLFEFHTRSDIVERYGFLPKNVQLEEGSAEGYGWPNLGGVALPEDYAALIDDVLTRIQWGSSDRPLWNHDKVYLLWGTSKLDMGNNFSVLLEGGDLKIVAGAINLTDINMTFVHLILSLAYRANQVLVCTNRIMIDIKSAEVIEPTLGAFASSVRNGIHEQLWSNQVEEIVERLYAAAQMQQRAFEN